MIRIIHAVPDMNSGGIENYIMNMYRNVDRSSLQFDFLVHHDKQAFFDEEILDLGGRIYRLPVLDTKNVPLYQRQLRRLFQEGNWKIVHGHVASLAGFYLHAAESADVPVRIAHSHGTSFLKTPKGYMKRLLFKGAKRSANVRLACSTEAGKYLFGNQSFYVVKNAIDSARFRFNPEARARVRSELGLTDDDFLVGHIGRFNLQKNHSFLIDVFERLVAMSPCARLLLVGTGETRSAIEAKVRKAGLMDRVLFQDVTNEPEAFYSAMDCFVLPSLFEGLPLVGIEAQCSGLPSLFADTISRETTISDLASYLPIDDPSGWAAEINSLSRNLDREMYASLPARHGYDSMENAKVMESVYMHAAVEGVSAFASLLD
ncbi:glycosyltransferase family 1 protein [Caniella muris]|uniref:glycosyltransferase family 1 protein n=1 Tax=Caniella muris TaxID=2941502 RepID=UPI00203F23C5|nr:glycosyltransferase family 1 protein [Caniella muris]